MFENPPTTAMLRASGGSGRGRRRCRFRCCVGDHHGRALCLLDLFFGGRAEAVRVDGELLRDPAVAEDLDAHVTALNEPRLAEGRLVHRGAVVETLELP